MTRMFPILALILSLAIPTLVSAAPAKDASCSFVLGFKSMHDFLGATIGDCVVDEHYNPQNGDGLQETSHGLLVWRKIDNWTAFTDGYRTWINGPFGVQRRLNTECLPWETACRNASGGSGGTTGSSGTGSTTTTVAFTTVTGAAPGGTASVTVNTSAGTFCTIDYTGPNGHDRFEFGALHIKKADSSGNVSWSWPISSITALGNGTVTVTCNGVTQTTSIPIGTTPIAVTFSSVTGAAPGGTASVTVSTSAGAFCKIDYSGPQGHDRYEFGALHLKQADSSGNVSWSWPIATTTPAGNGTVTVSCEGVTQSASVPIS